jgi:hypothetical protein
MGNNVRWDPKDLNKRQRELLQEAESKGWGAFVSTDGKKWDIEVIKKEEKPSKYHVRPQAERRYNGILFASVKEMDYYKDLELLIKAGEMRFFLRQVPFDLPGGVKYRVDFVEFRKDGSVRFMDVKGVKTDMFIMKRKQVQSLYPIKIETT